MPASLFKHRRFARTASCVLLLALVGLGLALASGCEKKRLYPETGSEVAPPPGAHARASDGAHARVDEGAHARASDVTQASSAVAAEADSAPAEVQQAAAEPQQAITRAELEEALPAEADLLSGRAAVFDDELIGFPMAGGRSYDPQTLVAAHRLLPLGSKVVVTSVATGKSVEVEIADRGPYEKDVIVNLSRKAAEAIGVGDRGEVTIKSVGGVSAGVSGGVSGSAQQTVPSTAPSAAPSGAGQDVKQAQPTMKTTAPVQGGYYVQVGAFSSEENANAVLSELKSLGYPGSRVLSANDVSRVQAGPFATRQAATEARDALGARFPAGFVVTPD